MQTAIVWLRQDLRLHDNAALYHAAKLKIPLTIIYIDDDSERDMPMGKYQKIWLHHSLDSLSQDLAKDGHKLHFFKGNAKKNLKEIIKKTQAKAVFWNRCYEPKQIARDKELKQELKEMGLQVETFGGFLLNEPWDVLNNSKEYFKVFTPYWKAASKLLNFEKPFPKPSFESTKVHLDDLKLEQLHLVSKNALDVEKLWHVGEKNAMKRLEHFLSHGLANYALGRDFPALDATSRLSPNIHLGEISPKIIVYETANFVEKSRDKSLKAQMEKFFSELGWREFSYNLLYHFPKLVKDPFKPQYASFPWKKNQKHLEAWQEGLTGYPIIDAGMRQLKETGWMHNRIRMVVGSFLVKNLMLHWHEGEHWFWEHLLDADLANNSASWQWVFGSGADAAPYFRVFNPLLQSAKFDPEGLYIKKYVPELKDLDVKYLHDPSSAPLDILRKAGISLGDNYPKALCDLNKTRDEVLIAYKHVQEEKE
jgi:deoxyribodipyrimidine photo-lyase